MGLPSQSQSNDAERAALLVVVVGHRAIEAVICTQRYVSRLIMGEEVQCASHGYQRPEIHLELHEGRTSTEVVCIVRGRSSCERLSSTMVP